jgi:hypothetical protein
VVDEIAIREWPWAMRKGQLAKRVSVLSERPPVLPNVTDLAQGLVERYSSQGPENGLSFGKRREELSRCGYNIIPPVRGAELSSSLEWIILNEPSDIQKY